MKHHITALIFTCLTISAYAQAQSVHSLSMVEGALNNFESLLNTPTLVSAPEAVPLGKNWFRLETDIHIFTDEANARQIGAILNDLENIGNYYNGKRSKLSASVTNSAPAGEKTADFVMISIAGPVQIKTKYTALVKTITHTDSKTEIEVRQTPHDIETNKDLKNLLATRYVEDVTINGKKYAYLRLYTLDDINASILPGAKGFLEKNSGPINDEIVRLVISAAKKK